VQQGETLWTLAQQFLGDPLLWPEIYRLNTATIEDPHWIFPGEELHLVAGGEQAATPSEPAAQAAQGDITVAPVAAETEPTEARQAPVTNPATGATIFASPSRVGVSAGTLQLREQHAYRAVREGEYYSAGFVLDAGEQLNAGRLLGNMATSTHDNRRAGTTSSVLYGMVSVRPPAGETLKPGDILLCYSTPRILAPKYGAVVRPTGLLKVTGVGEPGDNVTAQVVAEYLSIDGGQYVIRADTYRSPRGVRPVPVSGDSGVQGEVIDLRTPHEVANDQDELFINRGSEDGVHLGDVFQVSKTSSVLSEVGSVVQKQAQVLIVYLRPHTSTGLIVQIERSDIRPGAIVRQVRRMPS
jgi:hypothetical protein